MPSYTKYRYDVQAPGRERQSLAQRLFAWRYSRFRQPVEYARRKRDLLTGVQGDVLEIGPGPGANFEHLAPTVRWVGLEPNVFMHDRLRAAAAARGVAGEVITGTVDGIPLPDQSVDAVVATLVLCSVEDQDRALAEVLRVLRPGGRYLFLEHVAAPGGTGVRRLQDVFAPLSRRCQGGCRPNRETWAAIERAGFTETRIDRFDLRLPLGLYTPHIVGTAIK